MESIVIKGIGTEKQSLTHSMSVNKLKIIWSQVLRKYCLYFELSILIFARQKLLDMVNLSRTMLGFCDSNHEYFAGTNFPHNAHARHCFVKFQTTTVK